jgi:hypothetical protein
MNLHYSQFLADIRYRIKETGVKFLVVEENTAPSVLEAVEEMDSVQEVFVIGEHPGCTPVEQLMLEGSTNITFILILKRIHFSKAFNSINIEGYFNIFFNVKLEILYRW